MHVNGDVVSGLRSELAELHQMLIRSGLAAWTSGNVSARIPGRDAMIIKPSGVPYENLTADKMVICDLAGRVLEGELAASSDAGSHGYIYRHMDDVGGVVHTHSPHATAWAACGRPIPCVLTAMADEFGGEIPVGPLALIGDESIGRGVVDTLADSRSPAVLMEKHGVFSVGSSAREALKAAVMCEDVARTVSLALQLGQPASLDPNTIDLLHDRYQNVYGQRA
jgi:L-ribulose-5-phosphate 4-epimerase